MYLDEAGRPLYEPHREAWIRWASLTAVLLALTAALAAGAAAVWGLRAHLASGQGQRLWADYQNLTMKAEALKKSRDFFNLHRLLEHKNPEIQKLIVEKLKDWKEELAKLENEGEQLKAAAEAQRRQGERLAHQTAGAARTVWLLLLAVILAAASVPSKKKLLWLAALVLTVAGVVSFGGGFFLWF